MTVRELYKILNEKIPKELSCPWDNDGLMCCPRGERQVRRVLITLDVSTEAVEEAIAGGYDLIVSHHPFIFKGLRSIEDCPGVEEKAIRLIEAGVSVMSFHTRLDALEGGVNDTLCQLLGIKNVTPIYEQGIPVGRVGEIAQPTDAASFAAGVREALGAPFVLLSRSARSVHRVAVVGGSGKELIGAVKSSGADTFVSGRLDYHPMADNADMKAQALNLIEAGHFYTEFPICRRLSELITQIDAEIKTCVFNNNRIEAIQ